MKALGRFKGWAAVVIVVVMMGCAGQAQQVQPQAQSGGSGATARVEQQDLPKIAVYVTGNVGAAEKEALGTRILASLVNSGRYIAIERSNAFLAEIDKEHIKQRSGAIDDSQISELGKQFGVKFVCIAAINPVLGDFQVSARIVDVETAVVAFIGESASPLKTLEDLARVSDQVVKNMFSGQTAPTRKSTPEYTAARPEEPRPSAQNIDMDMVFVQGGMMENVQINDLYICKYEITQKQWVQVMGNNPSKFKGDDLPVEKVSWNDVQKFISKLNSITGKNYRLPSEEEWEYAARGGSKSNGYKYSGSDNIDEVAWYNKNSGRKTSFVGTKQPNELGIHDMSGNVWEWTNTGGGSAYVRCGGSWDDGAKGWRVSIRYFVNPNYKRNDLGFRLVLSP